MISPGQPVLDRKLVFMADVPLYAGFGVSAGYPIHAHDFIEIALILGGKGTHRSIQGDHPLQRGDVFILRPGAWHSYEACEELHLFNCCFGQELLHRELGWLLQHPRMSYLLCSGPLAEHRRGVMHLLLENAAMQRCSEHLAALEQLLLSDPVLGRPAEMAYLLLILDELGRHLTAPDDSSSHDTQPTTHPIVLRSIAILNKRFAEPWTTEALAEHLRIDVSYFTRRFKSVTGLPPMTYLTRLRAERAAELLTQTDRPIAGIGTAVGWADAYHFARRFKAHFGMTASAYRQLFSEPPSSPRGQ